MFHVILNDEVLPQPHDSREEAETEGKQLARAYEAEHGKPASWCVAPLPAEH